MTNNSTRVVFCKIRTKCKLYHLTSKRIYMHAIWGGLFLVSPTNTFFWFSPVTQNSLFLENHSLQAFGDYCCTATSMMSSFHWFAFHHYISPYIYRSTRRCKLQKNTFSFCSHFQQNNTFDCLCQYSISFCYQTCYRLMTQTTC